MEAIEQAFEQTPESSANVRHRLEKTSSRAMARMRLDLRWQSEIARHTDTLVATRLNLWRDIFPPALELQIMDRPVGHRAEQRFSADDVLPPWRQDRLFRVKHSQFNRRFSRRGLVEPRTGRFYPKGIVEAVDGVFSMNLHPFRVVEVTEQDLLVDFNHPLATKSLELAATIEDIWSQGEEHGGRCNEIAEMVTADGPGMQTRWRMTPTDFWSELPFLRQDPRPDKQFYAKARMVDHLDRTALAQLREFHGRLIPPSSRVLDLMSSRNSHLPDDLETSAVVGLGMNRDELSANLRLGDQVIHDLNQEPRLPFGEATFDAVVCALSVEYLIEPFKVFAEVARVLKPGGRFIVSFSNRWFPPKAIRLWEGIHEFERPGLVLEYFLESGRFSNLETWSLRGLPRPKDDKYADRLAVSDPLYAVWGERSQ